MPQVPSHHRHHQVQHQVSWVQLPMVLPNLLLLWPKIPSTYLLLLPLPRLLSKRMHSLLRNTSLNTRTRVTTTMVVLLIITITAVVELVLFHRMQATQWASKIFLLFSSHLTLKVHRTNTTQLSSICSHIYSSHNLLKCLPPSSPTIIHTHLHLVEIIRLHSISSTTNSNNRCPSNMLDHKRLETRVTWDNPRITRRRQENNEKKREIERRMLLFWLFFEQ